MKRQAFLFTTIFLLGLAQVSGFAQTRDEKVRTDRTETEDTGLWIYNDLGQGFATAKQTGKPLLIVFR